MQRRRVFYIPGYDPIHPRRYRELYRKEGKAQAEISGYEIGLKPKSGSGNYGWQVAARMDGDIVQADIDVLVWSDIVRGSMSNTIPATYGQLLRTAWTYIGSGALSRLMRMRKGPVIAALYPVGMLLAQLGLALLAFALLQEWIEDAGDALIAWLGVAGLSLCDCVLGRWDCGVHLDPTLVQGQGWQAFCLLPDA